jgi:hypothetical protein
LKSKIISTNKKERDNYRAPRKNKVSRQSLTFRFVTTRAALAAVRAGLTAVFAVRLADDHDVCHIDARRRLLLRLPFHRTRIRVLFTARAAHRAFAVLTAIRRAAARIFMLGLRGAVLLHHRAMRRRRAMVLRMIVVSENDRRQSENQHRRQRYQDSIFHDFFPFKI